MIRNEKTGAIFGALAAALPRQKRGHNFRVQDIWLASQAIQHSFQLITRNIKDFRDIPGLQTIARSLKEKLGGLLATQLVFLVLVN